MSHYLDDSAKGLSPDAVDKLRAMPIFLQDMQDPKASVACTSRAKNRPG